MIPEVFESLKTWVCKTIGEASVVPDAPGSAKEDRIVSLYLRKIENSPATASTLKMNRLQMRLTFLVTASSNSPHEANNDLVRLAFAAMTEKDMEADLTPPSTDEWKAFGVIPRPAFSLSVPLNFEVEKPEVKLVRKPLVIDSFTLSAANTPAGPD
ncbi:MAG: hypothetical protein K9J85_06815 [Desulfobacteraceae bacterium]|nr:hypothetical protein [Desulfobacteraceae bacterium]